MVGGRRSLQKLLPVSVVCCIVVSVVINFTSLCVFYLDDSVYPEKSRADPYSSVHQNQNVTKEYYQSVNEHIKTVQNSTTKAYQPKNELIIDAVFTYLNGSDPQFHKEMRVFNQHISPNRIRDYGQLRYAMSSAYYNAPFIRNFILVISSKTKGTQVPYWLNTSHSRIRVIEHKEIWDDVSDLPSMNSNAIEWATMNIPDIAELIFYFNDDMSLQRPLKIEDIYAGKNMIILHEAWPAPRYEGEAEDAYGKSLFYVSKLFDKRYRRTVRNVGSHVPMLFNVTIMKMIKNDWSEEFKQMYKMKPFRTDKDMQTQFTYQQYVRHHFQTRVVKDDHHFVGLKKDLKENDETFRRVKEVRKQYLCLQDGIKMYDQYPSKAIIEQVEKFYEDWFPVRAPWEID